MKNIKEIEKEFDEKFDSRFYGKPKLVPLDVDKVKDFLTSSLLSQLEDIQKWVAEERKRNDDAKCNHKEPRGVTANEYDCTDIHIGRAEMLSDLSTYIDSLK